MEHGYMYIVVRNDLTNAQKAVQSTHAGIEASREYIKKDDEHPSVIITVVKNERKLKKLIDKLEIEYKVFKEPDIGNEITALATRPLYGEERKIFERYMLLQ